MTRAGVVGASGPLRPFRTRIGLLWVAAWIPAVQAAPPAKYAGKCSDTGCHGAYLEREVVHGPVQEGTCDACHEEVDPATHTFKLSETGGELCLQCHDEYEGAVVHAPVSQGECTACHDPHGAKTAHLLEGDTVAALCADCHDDIQEAIEDSDVVHGPVAAGDCTTCHVAHAGAHKGLLVAIGRDLCFRCHVDLQERIEDGPHVHAPVETGCLECHAAHASATKRLLAAAPPELCLDCHDGIAEQLEDAVVPHTPVTSDASCGGCHDAHVTGQTAMLRTAQMPLCLSCHDREIEVGGRTIANLKGHLDAHQYRHGPIQDGNCAPCHDAHGGARPAMVEQSYPVRFYAAFSEDAYALCFECHDVAAFDDAETEDATEFRNGSANLHFVHVAGPQRGRACRACHDPHASDNPQHIAERVAFGNWQMPIAFRATDTGGSCAPGCHRPYRYDRNTAEVNVTP